ncbi:MAG: class II fructose-bisphosphate aldolase [Spirochaetales bacterium]|nr:class II fructose-bisphosphate aldolase [Spirochaetales bacterium]MCF7937966.1 class II fructose-bisphosphate aldolase [Spirochaetales bacterium]
MQQNQLSVAAILAAANRVGVTVPALNAAHLGIIKPSIEAARDAGAFVLIEVSRVDWEKFGARSIAEVYHTYSKWEDRSICRLHLDHVPVLDEDDNDIDYMSIIQEAVDLGYPSVMIDGSRLPLEDNIEATRRVTDYCHRKGVTVEAELGAVLGHENKELPPYEELFRSGKGFTDVEEARQFVNQARCDYLSVAVGNVHGAISQAKRTEKKAETKLNIDHLRKLREATGIPLVLHGGSGVMQEYLVEAAKNGIAKVNIGTNLRQAWELPIENGAETAAAEKSVYDFVRDLLENYFRVGGTAEQLLNEVHT